MNTITDDEQTEKEMYLKSLDKVGDIAFAVDSMSEELHRLVTECSAAKELILGSTVLIENLAGKLLQQAINFRHSYLLYLNNKGEA